MGKLFARRFGAVNQGDARLCNAESVAGLNHVSHLLHALLVGGVRNDGGI